jgi:hypothetical protein
MSKVYIVDGFYCIWVNSNDVPNLVGVVPTKPGEQQVIGFPMVLPMSWIQPPPTVYRRHWNPGRPG